MKLLLAVSLIATPAMADVYRCQSGDRTVYQDKPCPNARVIDNVNALSPTPAEQNRAKERAARERAFVDQRMKAREAEQARAKASANVDDRESAARRADRSDMPSKGSKDTSGRPDRYYDRPDRYYDRSTSSYTGRGQE